MGKDKSARTIPSPLDTLGTRYSGLRQETVEAGSGNIATNELTSPKTLGTSLNSSMGKSAGK